MAEAFHYLFQHTNRYEDVNKRIRLGQAVEGRDKKGIKKAIRALLKILHPAGSPTDEEFEEYVAYAVECRRRIKEQMNKRQPDDEFAKINLSYFNASGDEVIVYCRESKTAVATQQPARKSLKERPILVEDKVHDVERVAISSPQDQSNSSLEEPAPAEGTIEQEPKEQHFTILYEATGYSYESMFGPYLRGAKAITVEACCPRFFWTSGDLGKLPHKSEWAFSNSHGGQLSHLLRRLKDIAERAKVSNATLHKFVVGAVFLPLTFLTGVFGMNFTKQP